MIHTVYNIENVIDNREGGMKYQIVLFEVL